MGDMIKTIQAIADQITKEHITKSQDQMMSKSTTESPPQTNERPYFNSLGT